MTDRWDDARRQLVKATVGKGLDNASLALLEHVSLSKGLDPLLGELIAYGSGGKPTLITTINGMTKLCARELDGVDVVFYDAQGEMHPVWLSNDPPAACGVSVWRKGCTRPFTASCRFQDFAGSGGPWRKMPSTMIRKCALAAALRLGFADLLAGLYAAEEMEQAGFEGMPQPQQQSPAPAARPAAKAPAVKPSAAKGGVDEAARKLAEFTHGEVVEMEGEPEAAPEVLPERQFREEAMQVLWDRCREQGLTLDGWATLERQLGEITPALAGKIAGKIDAEKVALLNAGKATTGKAV